MFCVDVIICFVFKQKSASDMLISDWSSDVCSSDLTHENKEFQGTQQDENSFVYRLLALPPSVLADPGDPSWLYPLGLNKQKFNNFSFRVGAEYHFDRDIMAYASYATAFKAGRSEERRVGKECVSTCRSRWSPYH